MRVCVENKMEDPMAVDVVAEKAAAPQKQLKRKRQSVSLDLLSDKEGLKLECQREIEGLFGFYKEVSGWSENVENPAMAASVNSLIAGLMEERAVSFSGLAAEVYEKVKEREGVSLASVKSSLLFLGQRVMYGVSKADADVLEDESDTCLWCWETRDLKLFPPSVRVVLSTRRMARKQIHERLSALTAIMAALEKPEDIDGQVRALSNLNKVLNLVGICSLVDKLKEKNNSEMAAKEAKLKEKELIKEMEKDKRNAEKEKKKMDRQIQIEKIKSEKEQKKMQEEAEKEAKRREKEEAELKKQLKKQQEEAEKEQKRREKEEAELKKQILLKKQASMMERFLSKSKKSNKEMDSENGLVKEDGGDAFTQKTDAVVGAVTLSMDSAFSKGEDLSVDKIWRSHVTGWKKLMSNSKLSRWGFRRKAKRNVVKELKLLGSEASASDSMMYTKTNTINQGPDQNYDIIMDDMKVSVSDEIVGQSQVPTICIVKKKLLQFDKSHRPAYYGTWRKKSLAIGPRRPFKMDPDLDYEVDSDEEWEEEDPGESLSDCEKDKEDEDLEEENPQAEEEESEDSFVVPDGYLSEDEGIESRSQSTEEENADINTKSDTQTEELKAFFKQQKVLHNLTEQALRKSQPLIIDNLSHEKLRLLNQEGLSGVDKLEQVCMQALCMRVWPGATAIDLPVINAAAVEDGVVSEQDSKSVGTPPSVVTAVSDSDMPEFVRLIQSCPHGINKVVDVLQQKFPSISKAQLRNKVREVSKFVDNHWEVRKEILDALGLPATSPDKGEKPKGIALYFSKRCLPPEGHHINISETSPLPCDKSGAVHGQSDGQQSEPQSQPST